MNLLHEQIIINGLLFSPAYALFALAFLLKLKTLKYWPLALATIATLSPYIFFSVFELSGSVMLAAAIAISISILFGWFFDQIIFLRLISWNAQPTVLIVAAIGINVIGESLFGLIYGDRPLVLISNPVHIAVSSRVFLTSNQLSIFVFASAVWIVVMLMLKRSRLGLFQQAIESSLKLSTIRHVPVRRTIQLLSILSYGCVSMAGLLIASERQIYPQLGIDIMLAALVIAVAVNKVSFGRLVLFSIIISIANQYIGQIFPNEWRNSILYLALISLLIIRFDKRKIVDA